jgi:hypothetical protein
VLDNADPTDQRTQTQIAGGLLGPETSDVMSRVRTLARTGTNPTVVLFEPLQILSLAKAALLFLPPDGRLRPEINYRRLADALFRMSDLLGPIDFEQLDSEHRRREWIKFLFAMGIFYRGGHDLHEMARFQQLCLQPHEDLASDPDYIDFTALVRSATGLSIDLLWLGLTALMAQWKALDVQRVARGSVFIDEANFLSAKFHFSQEEQDRMFGLATSNAEATQAAVREQYRPEEFKPFDFVALADKPLVRIGHHVFCSSVPLLVSKLTNGLYYLLANSVQGAQRDRFTRFLGTVFEQYVVQLLHRMFGPRKATIVDGIVLSVAARRSGREGVKVADSLVLLDGLALVVESKARFFARTARSGQDFEGISTRIEDIFSRGAGQLESTIELAESGSLTGSGVHPEQVKAYTPIVVCLDETPLTPPIYDLITPVRPSLGVEKTVALQVLGVSELEHLEDAVARGALHLHALLGHKARSGRHAISLRNVVLQDPSLRGFSKNNPLLERVYNKAMKNALTSLKVRMR